MVGWQQLTAGYAVLIAVLAVWPFSPQTSRVIGPLDKLLHLCEYLLLAWCLAQTGMVRGLGRTQACAMAFVVSVGYGAFLEGVQAWLPYRQAEWGDLTANTAGAGLGVWLGILTQLKAVGTRQ